MKFAWTEKDKERFFKRAERQLKAAGIDFVQVDREQIGVKEWNAEKQTAGAVYVWLTSYPYNHFSTRKRGLLTIVGRNEAGFSFTFAKDAESTIEPQFKAHPLDKDGTLLIFDEDIVTEV